MHRFAGARIHQLMLARRTRARVSFFMNKFRQLGFIDYNGGIAVHSSLLNVVLCTISRRSRFECELRASFDVSNSAQFLLRQWCKFSRRMERRLCCGSSASVLEARQREASSPMYGIAVAA